MLGYFNPNVGLKILLNNVQLKVKVEVGLKFEITFLTQHFTQIWVKTTQRCLLCVECLFSFFKINTL